MKILFILTVLGALCSRNIYAKDVNLADDVVEDDEGVQVEDETLAQKMQESATTTTDKDLDPEEDSKTVTSSPDVDTQIHFTEPTLLTKELAAGAIVKFLVGFQNKGKQEFLVESMDVSFRYPMDYTFYIQNYTDAIYNRVVAPDTEISLDYSFIPSEAYAGRPLGLVVNLRYMDSNKNQFVNNVYNETINIIEDESGFNPETGFLYVVFGCVVILLLVLGQQFLSKMRKKHGMTKRSTPMEMGTSKNGDIDYDWIPKGLLQHNNKLAQVKRDLRSNQARKDQ